MMRDTFVLGLVLDRVRNKRKRAGWGAGVTEERYVGLCGLMLQPSLQGRRLSGRT